MFTKLSGFFSRCLQPIRLRGIAITVLTVAVIALIVSCLTPVGQPTILGTDLGHDYSAFYIAGKILNEYGPSRLYDVRLQGDLHRTLRPYWPADRTMVFPYPPFLAILFQPLARLPFVYSYLVWLAVSGGLYVAGLALILRSMRAIPGFDLLTGALLALSFEPFIMECWLGGQSSSIGFFGLALAYYLYRRGRSISSGFALGMCLYKPPLLVLILPLLLVARQGRILFGFALCGLALALISIFTLGWPACLAWFEIAWVRASGAEILPTHKYVDFFAFWQLLFGRPNRTTRILLLGAYCVWFVGFVFFLRKFKTSSQCWHTLALASVISWTATINVYFPVYDSILVVMGLLLTLDAFYCHFGNVAATFNPTMKRLLVAIYVVPGVSQALALLVGFQPYTLILILLGVYQLIMLREISRSPAACVGACLAASGPQPTRSAT